MKAVELDRLHGLTVRLLKVLLGGCLSSLLVACTVGPDYVRPPVDVGTHFKESPGWKVAEPAAHMPRGPWWQMYQDEVLTGLMQELNQSNQNIAQAEARFRQAVAITQGARSPLFPALSATGSMNRTGGSVVGVTGGASSAVSTTYNANAVVASWQLDIWGSTRRNIESTDASELALAADVAGARLTAQTAMALSYLQIRVLDEQRRLLTATLAAYQRALKLTQNRYDVGVSGKGDVAVSRTQYESTRAQLIDLEQQRAIYENAVAVLLGRAPSTFSIEESTLGLNAPASPVGLASALLERRPDIAAAEHRAAAANAQIGVATAAWFPSLTLGGQAGYRSTDLTQWLTAAAQIWAWGPQLAMTLLDGGARQAAIAQAWAGFDLQVAIYRQTVLQALQEVENAMVQMRVFEQEEAVQRLAVASAQESLRLARNQYDQGLIDYLNVAVLETTALNNERTLITLTGQRLSASVRLIAALGGGWSAEDLKQLDRSGNPTANPSDAVPTNR